MTYFHSMSPLTQEIVAGNCVKMHGNLFGLKVKHCLIQMNLTVTVSNLEQKDRKILAIILALVIARKVVVIAIT